MYDSLFWDEATTDFELIMNRHGYGFYSNYMNKQDGDLLKRIKHLEDNNIEFLLGFAYDRWGKHILGRVSLYIKDWNKPYPEIKELCELVNRI